MTAIFYSDCTTASDNGRFTLEARSPHNGTIRHRDGRKPSDSEFGFKYREHQSEFRYRLLDNTPRGTVGRLLHGSRPQVVWERWQSKREDSPHELIVSDDGWSVLRTHGFVPEVIAVAPDGRDALRVRITGPGSEHPDPDLTRTPPEFYWSPDHLSFSTAGLFWSAHSWHDFFSWQGRPHFLWRTSWGQRLVLDLAGAAAFTDASALPAGLAGAVADAERRGALAMLAGLSSRTDEVLALLSRKDEGVEANPLLPRIRRASAALHLVGVHRLREGVPHLREWELLDVPASSTGSTALPERWLQHQHFRPIVHHALKLLGEEPVGLPTYYFCTYSDNWTANRLGVPERLPDRRERAARVGREMSAEEVLQLLGAPDFVRKRSRQVGRRYEWSEEWEYDHLAGATWTTLRLTWEESRRKGHLTAVEAVEPYWLVTDEREAEYLRL